MTLIVKVKSEKLERAFRGIPNELAAQIKPNVLRRMGIAHENVIKRNRFRGYRGEAYPDRLQRRSGNLANAYALIGPSGQGLDLSMVSAIRSGLPGSRYAQIQEGVAPGGQTIRPKRGKFLTIPTKAALTPTGRLKAKFKIRRRGNAFTTDAGPTFLFKSRRGQLLIGIKLLRGAGIRAAATGRGRNKQLKAFYILKRSVTIKPRFGFFKSWKTLEDRLLPKLVARAVRLAMERAERKG